MFRKLLQVSALSDECVSISRNAFGKESNIKKDKSCEIKLIFLIPDKSDVKHGTVANFMRK